MPVFDGEIPKGSLVTVLYSANTYKKKLAGGQGLGEKQLSLNIQSVIVLGTEKKSNREEYQQQKECVRTEMYDYREVRLPRCITTERYDQNCILCDVVFYLRA